MRKAFKFTAVILLMCLALSACGKSGSETGLADKLIKVPQFELPELSEAQSLEMASYMSAGRAWISGDRIYCMDFDEKLEPVLASYDIEDGKAQNFRILKSGCVPEFLREYEGKLYFINSRSGSDLEVIDTDGEKGRVIKEGPCDFMRIDGDQLYYCDSKHRLYSVSLSSGTEHTVMTEACFYPYVINDVLIYQKASNEHLHMLELLSGADTELTDLPSYAPVIWDDRFYCTVPDGIYSMGLDGLEPVKLKLSGIQGAAQYYLAGGQLNICGTMEHNGIQSFNLRAELPKESFRPTSSGDYRMLEHAGKEYTVFSEYEAGGRFRQLLLVDSEGREQRVSSGKRH